MLKFLKFLPSSGVHRSNRIEKLGMHSSDTAEIYFDSVRVPSRNIIGEEGHGFRYQMLQFQDERLVAIAVRKFFDHHLYALITSVTHASLQIVAF